MNRKTLLFIPLLILITTLGYLVLKPKKNKSNALFITNQVDPKNSDIRFYWKNDKGSIFNSIGNLRNWLQQNNTELLFAVNGGMFKKDFSPVGLFIENGKIITKLDTAKGLGNFYLLPNGVFYITTDNIAGICKTTDFRNIQKVKYATQSGPMLLLDGQIHPEIKQGSTNLFVRNGVGILPNNQIVFAMSTKEINFYDLAYYFKKIGCKSALYQDGHVSRTYLPEQNWEQTDGELGVLIGVTKKN